MKIVERTPTRLRLRDNYLLGVAKVMLIGLLLFAGSVMGSVLVAKQTVLECRRANDAQATCQLIYSNVLDKRVTSFSAGQFWGAELEIRSSGNGEDVYQIVLKTAQGRIPLLVSYPNTQTQQDIVDQINTFINNRHIPSLTLKLDDYWIYIPGSLFALAGIGLMVVALRSKFAVSCLFDRDTERMVLQRRGFFNREVTERILHDIQSVEATEGPLSNSIDLLMRSGEKIRVLHTELCESPCEKLGEDIRQFLKSSV